MTALPCGHRYLYPRLVCGICAMAKAKRGTRADRREAKAARETAWIEARLARIEAARRLTRWGMR